MKIKNCLILLLVICHSLAFAVEEIKNKTGGVTFRLTAEEKEEILKKQNSTENLIRTNAFTFDITTLEGCE